MGLIEAAARSLESREKATELTGPLWPSRIQRHFLLLVSHNLAVLSDEAEARSMESSANVTERTRPLWPLRVWVNFQLLVFHNLAL
jgi:hypothetical protein